jgi:integrase
VGDIDTFQAAQFLKTLTPEAARQHRSLLEQLFRHAASNGYTTQRPIVEIERKKQQKRERARHTWEGHQEIYKASPPWLKIAIDAAFYTLQRRSDLIAINIDSDIDLKDRTIRVLQNKSLNYDEPVYIDITMGQELYDCVLASRFSGINCPMLVHHKQRITRLKSSSKPHDFAVTPDYLTRAYSKVRDEIGVYSNLDKIKRPGIHSLRALGIFAYFKAGYPEEYIMALSGHANKEMTAGYFEGHEKQKPIVVDAGLSLKELDFSGVDWATELSPNLLKIADSGE